MRRNLDSERRTENVAPATMPPIATTRNKNISFHSISIKRSWPSKPVAQLKAMNYGEGKAVAMAQR